MPTPYPVGGTRYHLVTPSEPEAHGTRQALWRNDAFAEDDRQPAVVDLPSDTFTATPVTIEGEPVVRVRGELDLSTASVLARVLEALLEDEVADVALDISGLSFIDSSGISALIVAQQDLHKRGRHLSIRSARPTALKVFEIAGLMDFLNVESQSTQDPAAGRG